MDTVLEVVLGKLKQLHPSSNFVTAIKQGDELVYMRALYTPLWSPSRVDTLHTLVLGVEG